MTHAAAFPAPVVLWSKPEEERAGKPLLVLLHGYGANEEDLLSLADLLPQEFVVASVRAPMVSGAGFTWFPLTASIDYSLDAVKDAASYVEDWLGLGPAQPPVRDAAGLFDGDGAGHHAAAAPARGLRRRRRAVRFCRRRRR